MDLNKIIKELENPCWKGYKMIGMKDKDGREVPNCVPVSEDINSDDDVNYGLVEPEEYDVEDEDMADFISFMRGYDKNLNEGCQCLREAEYQGREVPNCVPVKEDIDSDDDVNYGLVEPEEYDVEDEDMEDFIAFMRGYDKNLNEGCQCLREAEYQGREVKLGKPMAGDVKKFKVYVKNPQGNVVKVNFGQKGVKIKKNNPDSRRRFRARHNCDAPGPRHKARYWSCRKW